MAWSEPVPIFSQAMAGGLGQLAQTGHDLAGGVGRLTLANGGEKTLLVRQERCLLCHIPLCEQRRLHSQSRPEPQSNTWQPRPPPL